MTFLQRTCRRFMQPFLCVLIWCLVLYLPDALGTGNGIDDTINAVWNKKTVVNENDQLKVEKQWGVPDTTAYVGRLFRHHIPADAFIGNVHHFEVNEAYSNRLPKWLNFSNGTATLEGVPSSQDIGHYHISVTAVGINFTVEDTNSAQDIFAINVVQEQVDAPKLLSLKDSDASSSFLSCPPSEEFTIMSITLDANFLTMEPTTRVELAKKVMERFGVSKEALQLLPVEFGQRLYYGNTIMAGPGNVQKRSTAGMNAQWQIGCGHMMNQEVDNVISILVKNAHDGSLARFLEIPIIGWQLEAVQPVSAGRQKRQLSPTQSTPLPWPLPTPWLSSTDTDTVWQSEDVDHLTTAAEGLTPLTRVILAVSTPMVAYIETTNSYNVSQQLDSYHQSDNMMTASLHQETSLINTPVPTLVFPSHSAVDLELLTTDDIISPSMVTPEMAFSSSIFPFSSVNSVELIGTSSELPLTSSFGDITIPVTAAPDIEPRRASSKMTDPPVLRNVMQKFSCIAGKVSRFVISAASSSDSEDGNSKKQFLSLHYSNGTPVETTSWIYFDSGKQEIYAIPLSNVIGTWYFYLESSADDGGNVTDNVVEIYVQQHKAHRTFSHFFAMGLGFDTHRFSINLKWQMLFIAKLASFFGDVDETNIIVHNFTENPVILTWTNESLQLQRDPCPFDKANGLKSLMKSFPNDVNGPPSTRFRNALHPEFSIFSVSLYFPKHCMPWQSKTSRNVWPVVRNPINQISATVGRKLHVIIPEDTFFDEQDGSTYNLKLLFFTIKSEPIPYSSWIQFNSSEPAFIGLPLMDDVGSAQYRLVAMDKDGLSADFIFVVTVMKPPEIKALNVEFSLHIDYDYASFLSNPHNRLKVLDKIFRVFQDHDARYIAVRSITPKSVVFNWINTTLQGAKCPEEKIKHLLTFLFSSNGGVSQNVLKTFSPDFIVTNVCVIPHGDCLAASTPTNPTFGHPQTKTDHVYSDDDIYITTMIPAVVIAAMLLIAAIIGCVLYRKQRKGKDSMEDRSTFLNKGIPVILSVELEENSDPGKSPAIMQEEKPPLTPPDYPHSSSSASASTPPLSQKRDIDNLEDFGHDQSENSPPYQPPPPLTSNRDSRLSRPKHTPTYRLPPPYVPP